MFRRKKLKELTLTVEWDPASSVLERELVLLRVIGILSVQLRVPPSGIANTLEAVDEQEWLDVIAVAEEHTS